MKVCKKCLKMPRTTGQVMREISELIGINRLRRLSDSESENTRGKWSLWRVRDRTEALVTTRSSYSTSVSGNRLF